MKESDKEIHQLSVVLYYITNMYIVVQSDELIVYHKHL